MNNHYRLLNFGLSWIDPKAIQQELSLEHDLETKAHWRRWGLRSNLLNQAAYATLDELGLTVNNIEVFYTAPRTKLGWHIDMNPPRDFAKINLIWGCDQHRMEWGTVTQELVQGVTTAGSPFLGGVDADSVRTTISEEFQGAVLINAGRLHRVVNRNPSLGRWCVSVILRQGAERVLFDLADELLKGYWRP